MEVKERIEINDINGDSIRCCTIEFDDCYLHIYFSVNSSFPPEPFSTESKLLNESRKQNIGRGLSIRFDRNHVFSDPNKDHLHVYKQGNEILAINRDGTAHDGFSGVRIPNTVYNYLQTNYPDYILPCDRIIESLNQFDNGIEEELQYLIERQYNNRIR